jgi:hypothetical protein
MTRNVKAKTAILAIIQRIVNLARDSHISWTLTEALLPFWPASKTLEVAELVLLSGCQLGSVLRAESQLRVHWLR